MKIRHIIFAVLVAAVFVLISWWLHDDPEGRPLVCEQISPGAKYAKQCTPHELTRARSAYRWIVENAPPLSPVALAGVASFIEDTGRRKRSTFYDRLSRNDIDGACDEMLAYTRRRGDTDPVRVKRRTNERAMCLTKG